MIELGNSPRAADLDGSILWVIRKYSHEEWFHTITKLNKYCFLIHEETPYLSYIDPVARQSGAYCSNLLDFIEYYDSQGWLVYEPDRWETKSVFKITEEGEEKLNELVSEDQISTLESCLEGWDDMANLNLMDEVYKEYPDYNL